jgi:hypothetical protein
MVGGAAKGADCIYKSSSGSTKGDLFVYNKGSSTL